MMEVVRLTEVIKKVDLYEQALFARAIPVINAELEKGVREHRPGETFLVYFPKFYSVEGGSFIEFTMVSLERLGKAIMAAGWEFSEPCMDHEYIDDGEEVTGVSFQTTVPPRLQDASTENILPAELPAR